MANNIAVSVVADVKDLKRGVDDVNGKLGTIQKSAKTMGGALKGAFAFAAIKQGADALGGFLKGAFAEAQESIKVGKQTEAVLKSTGGTAGLSAKGFADLANAISLKTGIDDEQIQAGQNMLATFTGVQDKLGAGNDIFTQATKVGTDLAVATGVDQVKANVMLGKALNNPTKGVAALSRVGVTFTDQQKKQIKAMQKAGDTAGAQKIILGELRKEFGGSAEAQATAADKAKVAWDNFKESIGVALMPVLNQLLKFLNDKVVPKLSEFAGWLQVHLPPAIETVKRKFAEIKTALEPAMTALGVVIDFLKANPAVVKAFVITLGLLAGIVGVITVAQWLWNAAMLANPIGLIVVGIALLVAAIVFVATHLDDIGKLFAKVWGAIKDVTLAVFEAIAKFFKKVWGAIKDGVMRAVDELKTDLGKTWAGIKLVAVTVFGAVKKFIVTTFTDIRDNIAGVLVYVMTFFSEAWSYVATTVTDAWQAMKVTVKTGVGDVYKRIAGIPGAIGKVFKDAGTWLADAGRRIIQGLLGGLDYMIQFVQAKLQWLTDMLPYWKGPAQRDAKLLFNAGQLIMQSLVDGFDKGEDGVKRQLQNTTKLIAKSFDSVSSPVLSPSVRLSASGAVPVGGSSFGSGSSGGVATVNVTVNVPVGADPIATGRAIQKTLDAYYAAGGRRVA
jgi:phage-related protein